MKKKLLTILILVSVLFCMAFPVEASDDIPIFVLVLIGEDGGYMTSAAYVQDSTGNTYLVTSELVARMAERGYTPYIAANDFTAELTLLTTDNGMAFYTADGLEDYTAFPLASETTSTAYAYWQETEDGKTFELYYMELDLENWEARGGIYYSGSEDVYDCLIGAPVLNNGSTAFIGVLTSFDGELSMIRAVDYSFPAEGIVVKSNNQSHTDQEPEQDQSPTAASTPAIPASEVPIPDASGTDTPDAGEFTLDSTLIVGIAAVLICAAIVYSNRRKAKGSKPSPAESVNGEYEGTISLDTKTPDTPPVTCSPAPEPPAADCTPDEKSSGYQIRGITGIFEGQTFLLHSRLLLGRAASCDVAFPENTQGVSGSHCELTSANGHVVLRDLQSTYGTYLGRGVKMEPRVEYHLQEGDTFTMAEGTQAFRLERAGAYIQTLTPAVRAVADGTLYRADPQGRILFGRGPRCQVSFDAQDTTISSNHCVLYRDANGLFLMDIGSTNGTFFRQDQRLRINQPYSVKKGMSFFLASPKYTFTITED